MRQKGLSLQSHSETKGTVPSVSVPSVSRRRRASKVGPVTQAPERRPREFADLDEVAAAMRDSGHRVSTAVRIVLEALFAADGPVSAVAIAEGLGGKVPPLEQSSVYRNLER